MPYVTRYNRVATIISIIRVRGPGTVTNVLTFKVGERKFQAFLGCAVDKAIIQEAIKSTYEHETLESNRVEYRDALPGSKVKFKSTM